MRTLFPIFFIHSLTEEIDQSLRRNGVKYAWSPGLLATMVILLMIGSRILDRLSVAEIGSPSTDILALLVVPLSGYLQYRIQCAANKACGDSEGSTNKNYTAANFIWLGLGFLLWIMTFAGIYLLIDPSAFSE
ncbi:MAG: hypothetical protein ACRERV_15105, partial [Methylococcales bacterium]